MNNGVFGRFGWVLRFPFTLLLLAMLTAVAVLTNSHAGELSAHWQRRLGMSARDVWKARWPRFFTAALVTKGGWVFAEALAMIALGVGAVEWMAGPRRAASTFWGVHLLTILAESLLIIWPLHRLGGSSAPVLARTRDVGPSAGYFGALGTAAARLGRPWRWLAGAGVLVALVVAFFVPAKADANGNSQAESKLFADLAHIIAFPLGWLLSVWGR